MAHQKITVCHRTCGSLAPRMKTTFCGDLMLAVFGTDEKEIEAASERELKTPQELDAAMAVRSENVSATN